MQLIGSKFCSSPQSVRQLFPAGKLKNLTRINVVYVAWKRTILAVPLNFLFQKYFKICKRLWKVQHFFLQPQQICHIPVIDSAKDFQLTFGLFLTGTSVMSVSATDADDPMTENAFLSYSIIGQESIPANAVTKIMFGINNQTGAIFTRDVGLDREVKWCLRLRCRFLHIIIIC